jgi:hypothetical protein
MLPVGRSCPSRGSPPWEPYCVPRLKDFDCGKAADQACPSWYKEPAGGSTSWCLSLRSSAPAQGGHRPTYATSAANPCRVHALLAARSIHGHRRRMTDKFVGHSGIGRRPPQVDLQRFRHGGRHLGTSACSSSCSDHVLVPRRLRPSCLGRLLLFLSSLPPCFAFVFPLSDSCPPSPASRADHRVQTLAKRQNKGIRKGSV